MQDLAGLHSWRPGSDEQFFAFIDRIKDAIQTIGTCSVGPKPTERMHAKVRMYDFVLKAILIKHGFGEVDSNIIFWMIRGLSYSQVGKRISLSTSQVKKRAVSIFKRAGVRDRAHFEMMLRWSLFRMDEFLEFVDPADYGFDADAYGAD